LAVRQHSLAAIGLLVLALLVAFGATGVSSADAAKKRAACQRWGNAPPTQLELNQARKSVLCLLNKKRSRAGLPALRRNARLDAAAQRHNEQMDGTGCFAHECPGEADLGDRLEGVAYLIGGLLRWAFGENVAWGEGSKATPRAIVAAWMNSDGHRDNILSRHFREVGIGFSPGTPNNGEANGGIYTTDFGLRVG
jgi:uncharacterized protein YkwD